MMKIKQTRNEKIAIAGVGLLLVAPKITGYLANQAAQNVVNAAGGVATGTVLAIGDTVGIPRTNLTKCQQDLMAGKTWDASFSCPAGDYLKYLYDGTIPGVAGLGGLSATPVPDWKTLALVGGVVYLMMKKGR